MMNRNDLNRFGTLALLSLAVSIAACGGGDSEATGAPSPAPAPGAAPAPAPPAPAPAPAPTGDSSACWNDAMSTPGSSWKVTYRERGLSSVDGIVVTTQTLGSKLFNGQPATESRITTATPGKPAEVQSSYASLTGQDYRQFGWRLSNGSEVFLEPAWVTPRVMQPGQSATSTYTTRFANGSAPTATTTTTTTYLGHETITVPAGTFETCKVRFVDQGGGTSHTWTVASGPYRGLDVRYALALAPDGSSAWVREATAIEASFK
jgi:hypothetical protein